ncbi:MULTISPECIES: T9SS type A sorting domain-containing protein [unclassified Flavobacterium]|uniref:T9SS type A sorting domain-containing protein n=1 Tax=unclassified Flavobacterium TaxID=196869 RepID=UPI003F933C7A
MKTNLLIRLSMILASFFCFTQVNSQMFVSNNSAVYVNNQVVYIKNGLELNGANSNFYLRNEGQLLQGTTATSQNKGEGSLSVYQEGSVNNFQYNYWCSPVGTNEATTGNSSFGINQLQDVVTTTTSTAITVLPSSNYNGTASPLAIAPYWIWKLPATAASNWVFVGASKNINAGEGFTMKGTAGVNTTTVNGIQNNPGSKQRYDFRGKPNDGTISIPVLHEKLVLTGNPYPSAIDLSAFLMEATNSTGIAYFWEQDKTNNSHFVADYRGGYGTYSPMGGSGNGIYTPATFYSYDRAGNQGASTGTGGIYERRFSPIGQGFLIKGKVDGTVQMKNNYRTFVKESKATFSEFEKNSAANKSGSNSSFLSNIPSVSGFDYTTVDTTPSPQIRFNTLLNNEGVRQIVLAFNANATDDVDHGMDALSTSLNTPADIYFVMQNREYVIDAVQFDINKSIAIGFKNAAQANYKISVNEIINFTDSEEIYLHDKTADTYHDIKNAFHELSLPAGVNNTQFEITFKKGATLGINEVVNTNFVMYQNNDTKNLIINNPEQKELVSCNLYDIVGKLIFSKDNLGSDAAYNFSTSGLSDGIYIVKLNTNEEASVGQKIIIRN